MIRHAVTPPAVRAMPRFAEIARLPDLSRELTRLVSSRRHIGLALLLAVFAAPLPAWSQVPAETLPSFKANQVFDGGDIDHVNVYSGDVQLTIPLGPEYSLGSGITWRLTASYSNRYWNLYRENCGTTSEFCSEPPEIRHGVLAGRSTLGAGWSLEVGYITGSVRPNTNDFAWPRYHAPDGSVHILVDQGDGFWLPEDTFHARFRRRTTPSEAWSMELPDGSRWWFEHHIAPPSSPNGWDFADGPYSSPSERKQFLLTRIEDRYNDQNNLLQVSYRSDLLWQIDHIDLGARRIDFAWNSFRTAAQGSQPAYEWPVLTSISFPVAQSQTLPVTFGRIDTALERTSFESGPPPGCGFPAAPPEFHVPFLSSVSVGEHTYRFSYDRGASGYRGLVLQSLDLPTGGRIEYEYGADQFDSPCLHAPVGGCPSVEDFTFWASRPPQRQTVEPNCPFDVFQAYLDSIPSLFRRTEIDRVTGSIANTTYRRESFYEPDTDPLSSPDTNRVVRLVLVQRPDGNGGIVSTKHFFSVNIFGGPTGTELERRTYEGTAVGPGSSPVRSVVFCYDTSGSDGPAFACGVTEAASQGPSNSGEKIPEVSGAYPERVRREVTWYGKNPDQGGLCDDATATLVACWVREQNDWNQQAREFREVAVRSPSIGPSSIFLQAGQLGRSTTTTWTPSESPRWLPKLYSSRTVTDLYSSNPRLPDSVTTSYVFDTSFGKLRSSAVSDAGAALAHQLQYGVHQEGPDPVVERVVGTGAISGSFGTARTFQDGLVLTAGRTEPVDFHWLQFHAARDFATGLVTTSYEPNGIATGYTWDAYGRLTSIQPSGEAATRICYHPWNANAPTYGAWALVKGEQAASGCSLALPAPSEGSATAEAYVYDGFGRLTREIRLLPSLNGGSYLAVRVTARNDAGLVSAVSEWTPCGNGSDVSSCLQASSVHVTSFGTFDFMGRPTVIRLPDQTLVEKLYLDGTSEATKWASDFREDTITHGTSSGTTWASVRKDLFGRVIAATEPSNAAPYGPASFASWNVLDKLVEYSGTRSYPQGQVTQTRRWSYNRFGFLTSSEDPETGRTDYSGFDALGNATTRTNGGVTTTSVFDSLGRRKSISWGNTLYEESFYDGETGDPMRSDAYLGRLTRRVGYNPGFTENARVEDAYTYAGLGGRLSVRQTRFFKAGAVTPFVTLGRSHLWNAFGLPATTTLSGPGQSFSTDMFYRAGLPTRIVSGSQVLVSSAAYHPHGGLHSYTAGNDVTTFIENAPDGMPRPSRIYTIGATTPFDTGTFSYDGAGNVTSMGPDNDTKDQFTYDRLSRLKTATWNSIASDQSESFTFDGVSEQGFGSLIDSIYSKRRPTDPIVSLAVDPLTNRLADGEYDGRGNLLKFPKVTPLHPVPDQAFTYDHLSRRASDSRSGSAVSFHLYDGGNERVARVLPAAIVPPSSALRFFTLPPCRLLDTRSAAGQYGQPHLTSGQPRDFFVTGHCGVPSHASSVIGVLSTIPRGTAGGLMGTLSQGTIKLFPQDIATPDATAGTIHPSKIRSQTNIVRLSPEGALRLLAVLSSAQTVEATFDVFGYLAPLMSARVDTERQWLITLRDDGNRPVGEWTWLDGSSTVTAQSYHVFLGTMKIATREVAPTASWAFFASDHLGTPRLRTGLKEQGQVLAPTLESYRYRAFGQLFNEPTLTHRPGFEFAMMERDTILPDGALTTSGVGHHYDHARFFADQFGRFLSPDQASGAPEDPASWNRYTYARNNPLRYVDPDGRDAKDFIIGLGNGIRSNLFPGSQRLSYVNADFNRGQSLGDAISLVAGVYGIFGGAALQGGGASFSFATGGSSAAAVPVGALVSGYSVTVAGSAAANLMAASQFDGGSSERNPAQDKRLSAGEAKFLKEKGFDPEQLKADIVGKNVSKYDIFKDRAGNLYVKPKSGEGFGERLNMNIVELRGNM